MRYELVTRYTGSSIVLTVDEWDLYIGLEQRRPANPIGGDSHKSQGIGCWSTVNTKNSLQSGLKIIKFFSHENYRWEQFIAALELISDWDLTSSMNWIFLGFDC